MGQLNLQEFLEPPPQGEMFAQREVVTPRRKLWRRRVVSGAGRGAAMPKAAQ